MSDTVFSFQFGEYSCTVFEDNVDEMPASDFFNTVPEDELRTALENSPYDPQKIRFSTTQLLLDNGQQRILIDAGNGDGAGQGGEMLARIEAHTDRDMIDIVVLTHAHADHIGGFLNAAGEKNFPNAQYMMWQAEWDFYSGEERMEFERGRSQERYDYFSHYLLKLEPHLRLLNEDDDQVIEGIRAIPAYGHTRHHVIYEIESQGKKLRHLGDAFLHPLFLNYPSWTVSFEFDIEGAITTRHQLREELANSDTLLSVCHFPFPALGFIKCEDGVYSWEALQSSS